VRVFLHDPIGVAGDPQIVVAIDEAAVNRFRDNFGIAERIDDVAFGIELNDGGSGGAGFSFLLFQILPVHNEHVVLRIDADATQPSGYPIIGERPGPIRIHFEPGRRRSCSRGRAGPDTDGNTDRRQRYGGQDIASHSSHFFCS
jgi:hypothetical protein